MGSYGEAAHLLEAVQQLAAHFRAFASIPKVAELSGRVAGLEVCPLCLSAHASNQRAIVQAVCATCLYAWPEIVGHGVTFTSRPVSARSETFLPHSMLS